MKRYIDAEPIEQFIENGLNRKENPFGWQAIEILAEVHYAQTADVEPVRHGSWIPHYEYLFTPNDVAERTLVGYKCSECGREIHTREEDIARVVYNFPYCHCGAKMDEKEDNLE